MLLLSSAEESKFKLMIHWNKVDDLNFQHLVHLWLG